MVSQAKQPRVLVAGLGGLFTLVNLASAQSWRLLTSAPSSGLRTVACSATP
jgi:hypothetical protein